MLVKYNIVIYNCNRQFGETMKNLSKLLIDPASGTIDRVMHSGKIRQCIGNISTGGYVMAYDGTRVQGTHRIIWVHVNGPIPDGLEIDHINGVRHDNRIGNLRLVNRGQNNQNRLNARKDNTTSGIKGVSLHKQSNRWRVRIRAGAEQMHIGMYDTLDAARLAYAEAAAKYHTHNPMASK